MRSVEKVLVIQTAFLGDVVLTLPLIQELKKLYPQCLIDVVVIPKCAEILFNHPDIHELVLFDKRGKERGVKGLLKLGNFLRSRNYDVALLPHRSFRSSILAVLANIPIRIGFNTGSGSWMYSQKVTYHKVRHEVERNLTLLQPFGYTYQNKVLPSLYPSRDDTGVVDQFLKKHQLSDKKLIAIAPGTVWNTKRWLPERFAELAQELITNGFTIVLVGGKEDNELAQQIMSMVSSINIFSAVGVLSILQSGELIRRCLVLVTNDSAPLHLAVSMRTPVVAIFGATIPQFGFAPIGDHDVVIETSGLTCRPCSIHGGNTCPIKTFDCMKLIQSGSVLEQTLALSGIKRTKQM